MAIERFLAMTAAEFHHCPTLPPRIGWMSCLFSPYGTGLSNLPGSLPPGSLLLLSDYTPLQGHDREQIAAQLGVCVQEFHCAGVLLDFQRPWEEETAALAAQLVQALPCPVGVSEGYASGLDCPVFLSSVPLSVPLSEYLVPWQGREVWLEMALDAERITVTQSGAETVPLPRWNGSEEGFSEIQLHCHYHIETTRDKAVFTLWRTEEDRTDLLNAAEALGVTMAVGLWQEFGEIES